MIDERLLEKIETARNTLEIQIAATFGVDRQSARVVIDMLLELIDLNREFNESNK